MPQLSAAGLLFQAPRPGTCPCCHRAGLRRARGTELEFPGPFFGSRPHWHVSPALLEVLSTPLDHAGSVGSASCGTAPQGGPCWGVLKHSPGKPLMASQMRAPQKEPWLLPPPVTVLLGTKIHFISWPERAIQLWFPLCTSTAHSVEPDAWPTLSSCGGLPSWLRSQFYFRLLCLFAFALPLKKRPYYGSRNVHKSSGFSWTNFPNLCYHCDSTDEPPAPAPALMYTQSVFCVLFSHLGNQVYWNKYKHTYPQTCFPGIACDSHPLSAPPVCRTCREKKGKQLAASRQSRSCESLGPAQAQGSPFQVKEQVGLWS